MALGAAGCGGSAPRSTSQAAARAAAPPTARAAPAVIRAWSDALRAGKIDAATALFAVPVTVSNGTPPLRLGTVAQVRSFNLSLPCGAAVLRTQRAGPYTIATFRLTDRVGGNCGSGKGGTAATAFLVRRGRIAEWLRVPVPGPRAQPPQTPPAQPAPSQSA